MYSKDIEPMCLYCERGEKNPLNDTILCTKKGIVLKNHACRLFVYDPIKRVPAASISIETLTDKFTKEDFSID